MNVLQIVGMVISLARKIPPEAWTAIGSVIESIAKAPAGEAQIRAARLAALAAASKMSTERVIAEILKRHA